MCMCVWWGGKCVGVWGGVAYLSIFVDLCNNFFQGNPVSQLLMKIRVGLMIPLHLYLLNRYSIEEK